MKYEYELTQSELAAFNKIVNGRIAKMAKATANNPKLLAFTLVAWMPVGVAGSSYWYLYQRYPQLAADLNTIAIAAGLAALLITAGGIYKRKLLEKAVYVQDGWGGMQAVLADQSGLHVTTTGTSLQMTWNSFSELVEDDGAVYLFLNLSHAMILPKRVFGSAEELNQLREWARTDGAR